MDRGSSSASRRGTTVRPCVRSRARFRRLMLVKDPRNSPRRLI